MASHTVGGAVHGMAEVGEGAGGWRVWFNLHRTTACVGPAIYAPSSHEDAPAAETKHTAAFPALSNSNSEPGSQAHRAEPSGEGIYGSDTPTKALTPSLSLVVPGLKTPRNKPAAGTLVRARGRPALLLPSAACRTSDQLCSAPQPRHARGRRGHGGGTLPRQPPRHRQTSPPPPRSRPRKRFLHTPHTVPSHTMYGTRV